MSPSSGSAALRRIVAARAQGYCEYCRCSERFATESFTLEHIQPRAKGGKNTLDNLAWSCLGCNSHKHTKTVAIDPVTGTTVPLFNPRQQLWHNHFEWSEDFTTIIGISPIGRATVEALRLNRLGIVNLRCVLAASGLHPPTL
jgi:5-methylcytosine-specific restriction endonuclease McrA